jgi:O-antigen/teichoic acid export membrane protein
MNPDNKQNDSNTLQAFWVATGSLFSAGFALISSMILSRYFAKEDYGTYKQVMYVYTTLVTLFTLGLPKAFSYFLPRVPVEEAKSLIKKLTNLFFLLGGLMSVALFFGSPLIARILKNSELEVAMKWFSPVPLLMLPTMGLEGILSTYRKLKFMTIYKLGTGIGTILCVALPVMIFDGNYIQAIIGFVLASFLSFALALYFKYLPVKKSGNNETKITYNEIFKFSLPLLYASLWGILISSADQFFVSRYFGTKIFADFANGSLDLPFVGMIVGACATVLTPVFSRLAHEQLNPKDDIFSLWMSVFEKTAKLIYPLLLFCWVFADVLMTALYGDMYASSAIYFRIKTIENLFSIIVYAPLIIALGKTKFYANVHMYGAIVLIVLEYGCVRTIHSESAVFITLISMLCRLGRIFVMMSFVSKYFKVHLIRLFPVKIFAKIIFPSLLILTGLHILLVECADLNKFIVLVAAFVLYSIIFYAISFPLKLDYYSIIKPITDKFFRK